ncbi:hypothetical protein [Sphingomonas sp. PR090111-T3T-6A]|uniref:hypothetical protein n=1 Tax=Sphingomonas sp. PR090111-T3T-6A TaxID=685778 RepID=UPI000361E245|nr:hypothetical protein [Sphingomonas sp. PR090111-T3T-6A]
MSAPASQEWAVLMARRRIMARLSHLVPRKQQEIERAVRLLRLHFVDRRPRAPRRGILHRIMLVGPYARAGGAPDRETGEINVYEIWAFVDHPAYRGRRRTWGAARRAVAIGLRGRAMIRLSVFTIDEIDRLRAVGNRFLTDQYDGGLTLYDRAEEMGEGGDDGQ